MTGTAVTADAALLIAALVIKAGGKVVVAPGELHQVDHVDLGIEQLGDGSIEFTTRTTEATR